MDLFGAGGTSQALASTINTGLGIWHDYKSQKRAISAQKDLFNQQKEWEKEKALNSWQWTMNDLQNAGLNPTLMMGNSTGATVAGSSTPGAVGTPSNAPNLDLSSALKLTKELGLMEAQKENIDADTKNKEQLFELTPQLTKSVVDLNNSHSALNLQEKENKFQEQINTELKNYAQELANRNAEMDYAKRKAIYDKEVAAYVGDMQVKLKQLGVKDNIIYQAVDAAFDTAGKVFRSATINTNSPGTHIHKSTNINSPTVNY